MVQSLEQYIAQATQAYQPAQTAIQNQINALTGNLDAANERINRNYAQQQAGLDRQRNLAAENASMQAAGSGGSFGGAANIANRKYYDQSFIPAVTQMNTNKTNDLEQARLDSENQRLSLNSQLANLQAQANQQALAQYYADQEAEKNRQAQLAAARAAASANLSRYMDDGYGARAPFTLQSEKNMYGGYDWIDNSTGKAVKVATVAARASGAKSGEAFNQALYNALSAAANQGDYYSKVVADRIKQGYRYALDDKGFIHNNNMMSTLGIYGVN